MGALQTLPNLRRFSAHLQHAKTVLQFSALTHLQEIVLEGIGEKNQENILDSLSNAMAQNRSLASIDITADIGRNYKSISLHYLLMCYPASTPASNLTHVGLSRFFVRFDNITMPHLKHLSSLSLTRIRHPSTLRPRYPSSKHHHENQPVRQDVERYSSSLEDIWKALGSSEVLLEAITVDDVPQSFLDYLSSYSALKKSTLTTTPFTIADPKASKTMAKHFFDKVLIHHALPLEDPRIWGLFQSLWCFGPHNVEVISKCINLKSIRMNAKPLQSIPATDEKGGLEPFAEVPDVIVSNLHCPNSVFHSLNAKFRSFSWTRQ